MNLREIEAAVVLPELPQATRARFMSEYALSSDDAFTLTESREWISFTEAVFAELYAWLESLPGHERTPDRAALGKLAGGWLTSKLLGKMGERGMMLDDLKITPENFAELLTLIEGEKVGSAGAQALLDLMLDSAADPSHLMEEHGLGQVRDTAVIEAAVVRVIEGNHDAVAKYRDGKTEVIKFLIGMVMKETEGKADPRVAEELLKKNLR